MTEILDKSEQDDSIADAKTRRSNEEFTRSEVKLFIGAHKENLYTSLKDCKNISEVQSIINNAEEMERIYNDAAKDIKKIIQVMFRAIAVADKPFDNYWRICLAERLIQARKENNLSQADVAKKLGMSIAGYAMYESTRREPPLKNLVELSHIFGKSIDWLVGLEN